MGKYDSEYSALKALANAVGCTTPIGGWDSSYSIMSSMYAFLIGTSPSSDSSMIDMISDIREGVVNGTIELGDQCAAEIARLNEVIQTLEYEVENAETIKQQALNELRTEKDAVINDLLEQLENASTPSGDADLLLFGQIGYTEETASTFYNKLRSDLEYSKEVQRNWDGNTSFSNDSNLTYLPYIDTSGKGLLTGFFQNCSSLIAIPLINTSNVTYMGSMFYGCSSLSTIPLLDTSKVTNMDSMFSSCTSLTSIPQLNTSNVTDMGSMFSSCRSLITIPQLDTSNVTDMGSMFSGCTKLESLPLLDFSSVTSISVPFGYSNITTLTDLGGFTGLKIDWTSSLSKLPNLTKQSLLNVFNTIADVNSLGGKKLEIGTTNLNKLTDEEKSIATNKGWTLS